MPTVIKVHHPNTDEVYVVSDDTVRVLRQAKVEVPMHPEFHEEAARLAQHGYICRLSPSPDPAVTYTITDSGRWLLRQLRR